MKISIIGTGQVAKSLGKAFFKAGHTITWVYGRDWQKSMSLAVQFHSMAIDGPAQAQKIISDVTLLAVKDDAVPSVAREFSGLKNLVVHSSGSLPLKILTRTFSRNGVFYPLQTFATGSKINYKRLPLCLEAGSEKDLQLLLRLAGTISRSVYVISSEQRAVLHLSAVFANNFTNHLFWISEKLLEKEHLSFDLLKPIILTSARNLQHYSPAHLQTGPAKRGDRETMAKHLAILKKNPSWKQLYQLFSDEIENNS